MSESPNKSSYEQLSQKLNEKRNVYNQMFREDKEFEEVKTLFMEIRGLEKTIEGWHVNVPDYKHPS